MAGPKAKKKAVKSGKPAKARGGTVKKAVAAVKKAVSKKKPAAKASSKAAPKSSAAAAKKAAKSTTKAAKPAKKATPAKSPAKSPAKKAVTKKSEVKKSVVKKSAASKKAPAKPTQVAAKKPAARAKSPKSPAVASAGKELRPVAAAATSTKKTAKAVLNNPKIGRTMVRAQAAATTPAARSVRAAPARAKPGKPLEPGKIPSEAQLRKAPDSQYMNDTQLAFFQQRLLQMRSEVLAREIDVKERLHQREVFADPADRASAEEEHWLDLRLRERESLLLKKIDDALRRIRDKDYGFCEKTGEPIGIARLLARPTATVCVDVKGQNERAESQYRDR